MCPEGNCFKILLKYSLGPRVPGSWVSLRSLLSEEFLDAAALAVWAARCVVLSKEELWCGSHLGHEPWGLQTDC